MNAKAKEIIKDIAESTTSVSAASRSSPSGVCSREER